jgi:CHAT domain-containing protein
MRDQVLAAQHLIYEPSGALVSLPVGALVTDAASGPMMKARRAAGGQASYVGVKWLGAQVPSSLVVSPASFLQSRRFKPSAAQRSFLGFGDPEMPRRDPAYASIVESGGQRSGALEQVCGATRNVLLGLEPLPETAQELRVVGGALGAQPRDLVTRAAFNDAALKRRDDLGDYRVVYFATHALLPQPAACLPLPALITSLGGAESDALLDASEILDLRLDADLVVLAACNTAGSEQDPVGLQGGGEALGGLARAMIYAGARGLVVSHWAVDSDAAMRLMIDLFGSGAPDQAQGLLKAQQQVMSNPATSHPYFWAPFTVVGDGARPLQPRS